MLVTSLCWWLYDGDWFKMLVTESLCWWLFSLCWWFSLCIKSVTNILNRSPTSQTCHQHIWSPTSVTNIDVTLCLNQAVTFWQPPSWIKWSKQYNRCNSNEVPSDCGIWKAPKVDKSKSNSSDYEFNDDKGWVWSWCSSLSAIDSTCKTKTQIRLAMWWRTRKRHWN